MANGREAMNMGSRSGTIVSQLNSVITSLASTADSAFNKITSANTKMLGGGGPSGTSSSGTLVAANPVFSSAPQISQLTETGNGLVQGGQYVGTGSNIVARGPSNLSAHSINTGQGSTYQPELGSVSRGGGGGGSIFGSKNGAGGGSGSGGNPLSVLNSIPVIGAAIAGGAALYNSASNLTPSTSDVLEAQLLQQRASFFTGGQSKLNFDGKRSIGGIRGDQLEIAKLGMLSGDNPQMDVLRAQVAAQSYGLTGPTAKGGVSIMASAANASNLMPGLGVEGTIRATGAMQQANNVNMLRGIGIQLRGSDGSMKGPSEVIEEVWKKLCRDYSQAYGASKSPSLKEVQISLQPGNALDSMLNQYFGNDPMLKQLVANGIIFKAQGGGAINKANVADLGGTTSAMTSYSETAAAGQDYLGKSAADASKGFGDANSEVRKYYEDAGVNTALSFTKAFGDTLLTAFGGNPMSVLLGVGVGNFKPSSETLEKLLNVKDPSQMASGMGDIIGSGLSGLKDLISNLLSGIFKAEGGPVDGNTPYIVGEKGPELFVPSTNGAIVPNNKLKAASGGNTYNITVNAASGSTGDLVNEIKKVLTQIETNRKVSEV